MCELCGRREDEHGQPADGTTLRAAARALLCARLGPRCGFVRFTDTPGVLLACDAARAAEGAGVTLDAVAEGFRSAGWPASVAEGLLYLDALDAAFAEALARRAPETACAHSASRWADAQEDAALQALCVALLRQPPVQRDTPAARVLLRAAWRGLSVGRTQAQAWGAAMRGAAASAMREEARDGLYACGVLLLYHLQCAGQTPPREAWIHIDPKKEGIS